LVYVCFMFLFLCIYLFILFLFSFSKRFYNMFYNENNILKSLYFCLIRCRSPCFPQGFLNRNGTSPGPPSGCPSRPALPCPVCHHRQTDTTIPKLSSVPNDNAFPYGRFCSRNIENAFAAERRVIDRRTN
jgi:hypothetical protein